MNLTKRMMELLKEEIYTLDELRKQEVLDGSKELIFKEQVRQKLTQLQKEVDEEIKDLKNMLKVENDIYFMKQKEIKDLKKENELVKSKANCADSIIQMLRKDKAKQLISKMG